MRDLLIMVIIIAIAVALDFGFGYVLTRIGGKIGLGAGGALLLIDLIGETKSVYASVMAYGIDIGLVLAILFKVLLYVMVVAGLSIGLRKNEEA